MLEQIAQQLEHRRSAMDISYYQIQRELMMTLPTVYTVFQKGKSKGKGYNVKNLLDIAAYLGITLLRFENTTINVTIEPRN